MDKITALTLDFVRHLSRAIRAFRLYSPEHRQAQTALQESYETLTRMLEAEPSVLLGTKEGALILQGNPLRDAGAAADGFCALLASRNVSTFTVQKGVTYEEFCHLIRILSMSPDELIEGQSIKPVHLKPLANVKINEKRFVAVDEGAAAADPSGVVIGGATLEKLSLLVNSLLAGSAGGGSENPSATGLQALAAAMAPLMGAGQQNEAIQVTARNFDLIVEHSLASMPASQFIDEYLKGVGALPDPVKRALLESTGSEDRAADPDALIERLPLAMRGRILAQDIEQGGVDPDRLRPVLRRLAPSPGEFVDLIDLVSRLLAESAATPADAERKIAELFKLVPLADERRRERPSALVLAKDRKLLAACTWILEEGGFGVTSCRRPDPNLHPLLQARAFDAVVVDISPYRMNQLEFLAEIRGVPSPPTLILIDDILKTRQPSEVELCTSGRVLYKPVEPAELVELARAGGVDAERQAPPPGGEVEQARRLQRVLAPDELPVIPGYTVAVRYERGSAHGGNYHDVVSLPGRRYGLLLVDLTGSPAASVMGLIAVRMGIHRILQGTESAPAALARLNDLLIGEIPRGTFVRALYAVLDPKAGQLSVAGGGHPRPLRWSDDDASIRVLQTAGAPLGLAKGKAFESTLRPATVTLAPGDHLLFHTLAVTQSSNAAEEELGERGLARAMKEAPKGPAGFALVEVVEAVLAHRQESVADDFTLLELRCEAATSGHPAVPLERTSR